MDKEKELENISRHMEKTMLEIEVSDIIWNMHQNTYKVTAAIITLQLLLCILIAVISVFFGGIKTDFHGFSVSNLLTLVVPYINIGLMIIVVINNRVNTKAWHEARERYNKVFELSDKVFDKDYNVEDQFEVVYNIGKYKEESVKKCKKKKHKKQDIEMQKVRSMK